MLNKEELEFYTNEVHKIMDATNEDEPSEKEAIKKLREEWLIADSDALDVELRALFRWPDYVSVNGRMMDIVQEVG